MGYQRNKKIYVIQSQHLQTTDKGKRSASKNRKTKKKKKLKYIEIKQQIFWKQVNRHIPTNTLKRIRRMEEC